MSYPTLRTLLEEGHSAPDPEPKGPGLGEILLTGAAIVGVGFGLAAILKALFGGKN